MPPTSEPTADNTALCAACGRYVPGTDGDGNCPPCAAGLVSAEEEILAVEAPAAELEPDDGGGSGTGPAGGLEPTAGGSPAEVQATPAAIRRAAELGIDLATVTGTGAEGRVTKDDVDVAAGGASPAS